MQKLAPAEAECFVPQLKLENVKEKMIMAFDRGRFSKTHFSNTRFAAFLMDDEPPICMGGGITV